MGDMLKLIWWVVIGLFRSRASLEAEIMALRRQLIVLRRKSPKRLAFSNFDRLIFASLYRIAPNVLNALVIVKPETVIRWHRAGFRLFWRWRSRSRGGRPKVPLEIRQLIRAMSLANPLWGAPRIHGELLKLGIEIGQTSVAKCMARHRKPPSQGWKTFLRNHADGIASMDLFVVPTLSFRLLYGLLILSHGRRQILWLGLTTHPTAEWMAQQGVVSDGARLSPTHAVKKGKRYRYYVSTALITGSRSDHPKGRRIPAGDIERLVLDRLRALFASGREVSDAIAPLGPDAATQRAVLDRSATLAERWTTLASLELRQLVRSLVQQIQIGDAQISVWLNRRRTAQAIGLRADHRTFRPVAHRKPSPGWKGCASGGRQWRRASDRRRPCLPDRPSDRNAQHVPCGP
jgi:hypothetical protein